MLMILSNYSGLMWHLFCFTLLDEVSEHYCYVKYLAIDSQIDLIDVMITFM